MKRRGKKSEVKAGSSSSRDFYLLVLAGAEKSLKATLLLRRSSDGALVGLVDGALPHDRCLGAHNRQTCSIQDSGKPIEQGKNQKEPGPSWARANPQWWYRLPICRPVTYSSAVGSTHGHAWISTELPLGRISPPKQQTQKGRTKVSLLLSGADHIPIRQLMMLLALVPFPGALLVFSAVHSIRHV